MGTHFSVLRFLFFSRWQHRVLILSFSLASAVFGLMSPLFQKLFIDGLMGEDALLAEFPIFTNWPLISFLGLAFVMAVIAFGLHFLTNYLGAREGVILQQELAKILYARLLRWKPYEYRGRSVGEVVSVYGTDLTAATTLLEQALPTGAGVFFPLILAPFVVFYLTGVPFGLILGFIGILFILMFFLALRQARFFYRFKRLAAERIGIVNEWVQNIKVLRLFHWEKAYEEKIFLKRKEETEHRIRMVTNGQIMGALGSSLSFVLTLLAIFYVVRISSQPMTPGDLFALLWIFGVFLARPFRQVPWVLTFSFDALTSAQRLEQLINQSVQEDVSQKQIVQTRSSDNGDLEVSGLNLSLEGIPILKDISFNVKSGEFVAIVGPVGSGKTSLLLSLMGELSARFDCYRLGQIDSKCLQINDLRRFFSYFPQDVFTMSATIRDNVHFEYDTQEILDNAVYESLSAAQLNFYANSEHDLGKEIGERGVNLSGGQKQRLSLARVHRFDRPVVLLDECLSALDEHTENKLLSTLFFSEWRSKTRIIATHRLTLLNRVDRILFMEKGEVLASGTLAELIEKSPRFKKFYFQKDSGTSFEVGGSVESAR